MSLLDDITSKYIKQENVNTELLEKVKMVLEANGMPTINLDSNVNSLIITKTNDRSVIGNYKKDKNKLVYSDDASYVHELFHVASSNRDKKNNSGIRITIHDRDSLIGLDEGITDYLTSQTGYETNECGLLRLCVELIVLVRGKKALIPYCENDGVKFCNQFSKEFLKLAHLLDEYYYSFLNLINFNGVMMSHEYFELQEQTEKKLIQALELMIEFFTTKEFKCKEYLIDKINSGYLKKEFSVLGIESIDKIFPKGLK